ncbi:RNA-directed DNA polymerase, eukaryota [Tanacetum coccineum]
MAALRRETDNVGVNSWFSEIRQTSLDINPDGRIVWVEVEGVPLKLWSMNSFRRIASKWGDLIDVDDIEEYCFHSKRLCLFTKCHTNIFETFKINFHGKVYWIRAKEVPGWVPELLEESDEEEQSIDGCMEGDNNNNDENNVGDKSDTSEIPETVFDKSSGQKENKYEDPFDLYPLLNKNKKGMMDKVKEVNSSPLYPPGFTPNNETNDNCGMGENSVNCNAEEEINVGGGGSDNAKSKEYGESMSSGRFKRSEAPRTGGSFLGLMEEVVKVGQTMGYNMEGVVHNLSEIIESHGESMETKMEKIDMFSVRRCWGNLAFEFLHSDSVGNSGGVWIKNGTDLLIIVVYAPHDSRDKRMLWDYLVIGTRVLNTVAWWSDEVVIMGDFNEVRYKSDRYVELCASSLAEWRDAQYGGFVKVVGRVGSSTWLMRSLIWEAGTESDFAQKWGDERGERERATIEMCYPRTLSSEQCNDIERMVSKEEIKAVVWDCGTDKSPGPDGFTFGFYRYSGPDFEGKTFFISLIGSTYKIIAKILANRLVAVLGDIVDEVQSAFIAGRQIMDVFVGQWSDGNINILMHVLDCFHYVSGLKINMSKIPFLYLGTKVGGAMSRVQAWKEIVDKAWDDTIGKLKARLSNWKLKTLSVGGRLTLLKSVLGSTPIYNMSIYKKYGGLGVSSFYALNRVLLFKWVWRFISRDNSLWCRLITSMHGSSLYKLSPFRYSTWKSIIREVHMLKDRGVDLISHCHIRVGNGLRTQFWNEVWIGDTQLRVMFPRIYALEINKDCTVADKLQFSVTSSLRRSVRGGVESSQLALLQTYIEGTLLSNMEDRWVWDLNGEGVFRVKDVRILLDECFLPKAPTATRWVKYVPIKINVFAWKVFLDRLPTRSNLQHRGVLVSDLLCPLCSSAQEDSSHLFFSCRLATDIVRLVCRWWNLSWTPLGSYADWLNWFNSIRLSSKVKDLLEGVLYITWWSVWMFRNQLLFSSKAPRKDVIFDDIVSRSFTWCLSRFVTSEFELSSSLPASKLFKAYDDFENVAPKVDPETYKALVTVEGDGGVGTIRDVHFGMPFKIGKAKLDVVDKENYAISYTTYEGDVLMGILDSTTHHIKFTPSADGGCVYKQTVVYNCKDDTPLAEEYLNIAKEALKKTFKAIESHIHANPHAY